MDKEINQFGPAVTPGPTNFLKSGYFNSARLLAIAVRVLSYRP
jgi:hypothetical protein